MVVVGWFVGFRVFDRKMRRINLVSGWLKGGCSWKKKKEMKEENEFERVLK
jgi:hypothetical protein